MRDAPKKRSKTPSKKSRRPVKKRTLKIKSPVLLKLKSIKKAIFPEIVRESPAPIARHAPRDSRLPERYGENKLALLARDPWWLYAYWEVTPEKQGEIDAQIHREGLKKKVTVLRVYDITGVSLSRPNSFFDIELHFFTDNWYVDVGQPGRQWVAELGVRTENGRFFMLVRSNIVETPSFGISDVLDEEWMLPEEIYFRIVGPTGFRQGASSLEIRRMMEKHLRSGVSSKILTNSSAKRKPVKQNS